ncbi:hypothetical protein CCOS865_03103 [Pseudomonas reidholzensis]|uniref:Aldose 1-epimerase n=1 Tax=Pseudomonas reidholzensis TaxID=1785162 RepID=A0A383RWH7_9PSED|nr:aldose 1-epimerase [Pseudomonas reidholzensis]SYX90836.1 hypothetical protein CCOS865_03103 [Pseudomonas reidholzensis]
MHLNHALHPMLKLTCGALSAGVLPSLGGALGYLRLGRFELLRPWDGSDTVRRSACYPLLPYSNRIAHGRFAANGQVRQLRGNFGDHPHPLHGLGWQRAWQVDAHAPQSCRLSVRHRAQGPDAEDWPWDFVAWQCMRLSEQGLHLNLGITNLGTQPMPAGLGWHPYFERQGELQLGFSAAQVWRSGADGLPNECTAVPEQWDFSTPRPVGAVGLDNCFAGWDAQAHLHWPHAGISLRMEAGPGLEHLVVFTPPAPADFIAVEPVSHLNNAINFSTPSAHGLVWLEPGASTERELRLLPSSAHQENLHE